MSVVWLRESSFHAASAVVRPLLDSRTQPVVW